MAQAEINTDNATSYLLYSIVLCLFLFILTCGFDVSNWQDLQSYILQLQQRFGTEIESTAEGEASSVPLCKSYKKKVWIEYCVFLLPLVDTWVKSVYCPKQLLTRVLRMKRTLSPRPTDQCVHLSSCFRHTPRVKTTATPLTHRCVVIHTREHNKDQLY